MEGNYTSFIMLISLAIFFACPSSKLPALAE
jgi:hypothetical protein